MGMMVNLLALPSFDARPTRLDFSPVQNALAGYSKGMDLAYQGGTARQIGALYGKGDYAGAQRVAAERGELDTALGLGKAQREKDVAAREDFKAKAGMLGNFIEKHVMDPSLTPEMRAARWQQVQEGPLFKSDSHFNDPKYGQFLKDPTLGPQMVLGMISPYRDALATRGLEAQAAENEASAALKGAQADVARQKPADTFDLAPDHTRFQQQRQPDGSLIVRPVATGTQAQDATTKKAIDEADDFILQNKGALGSLKQALQLNEKAYDGALAEGRAKLVNNTWSTENSRATTLLENVVTNQALQSLRSTFGGNPTEGERKILLDVAGSVNQPRVVREQIYRQAQAMAEARLAFNQQKAAQLRSGNYYKPGGQPDFKGAGAQSEARGTPKQAPDGNWYVPDPNRPGKYLRVDQ